MNSDLLLKASKLCGSQRKLAKRIRATPTQFNAWINSGVDIPYEYAVAIEKVTDGIIAAERLSPDKARIAQPAAHVFPQTTGIPIKQILISSIQRMQTHHDNNEEMIIRLSNEIKKQGLLRPIAVDLEHQLIFGGARLQACQLIGKTRITSWLLDLTTLLQKPFSLELLKSHCTISEWVAVGIALEKLFGHGHGGNRRHFQVQNSALEPGKKIRDVIAQKLGFGSHFTYEQAKKIYRCNMPELIQAVDRKRISISTAVYLIQLPLEEQQLILNCDEKSIIKAAKQLREQSKEPR